MSGGYLLTTGTVAMCPHGGQINFTASQTEVKVDGDPVLVVSDQGTVLGCPFVAGVVPSPCIDVIWQMPATQVRVGQPVVLDTSIGLCLSATLVPQGPVVICSNQSLVRGR